MIKTPLSTVIGGAGIWTPGCTVIGGQQNIDQIIKSLFSDGTQGLYLNAQNAASVSDLSSIKDLSGRNNHATQANATSRASLITDPSGYKSLKFDGIDDGYVTPSINFSNTDKVTVIAAVRKLSDASAQVIAEFGSKGRGNGVFTVGAGTIYGDSSRRTWFSSIGYDVDSELIASATLYPSPDAKVATALLDKKKSTRSEQLRLRLNSTLQLTAFSGEALSPGNYGNYPLYIGRRGGNQLPFNGQIYALLVIGKLLDDATTARIEKEFAKYIGVTL